jgi:pre-mRNA-processing factor 8
VLGPYNSPAAYFIKHKNLELDKFYFNKVINPIAAYKTETMKDFSNNQQLDDEDLEKFTLSEFIEPFINEAPLFNENTTNAINIYWATDPFNRRTGKMKRNYNVPLISSWFRERCPQGCLVVMGASY